MRSLIASLVLCGFLAIPCFAAEPVVLVTNEYVPYVSTSTKKKGFIAEVVIAAFHEMGVETKIEFRPWRRCAMLVEDGAVFGAFPYIVTENREKYAWFSDPVWECRAVFFYLKGRLGDFDYSSLHALKDHVIAGTSGNFYEEVFEEAGLSVDYAPGEASGLRKVWEMRAELFAEEELVGWSLITQIFPNYVNLFGSTPTAWNVSSQRVMVSKKYPGSEELMIKFNAGLARIRENGTYQSILERYACGPNAIKKKFK